MRRLLRDRRRHRIKDILRELQSLSALTGIRSNGKSERLTSVKDNKGEVKCGRQEIVYVFATSYETLYESKMTATTTGAKQTTTPTEVEKISSAEVKKQLRK